MTTGQKIIKYCALALAVAIIANIIYAILFGIYQVSNIIGLTTTTELQEMKTVEIFSNNITTVKIDLKTVNLHIKTGSNFSVQTNNKNIKVSEEMNQVKIKQAARNGFHRIKGTVQVTIPNNSVFNTVEIENGAGQVKVQTLTTENLELELGVGKVDIKNLIVPGNAKVDGGVGNLEILNGSINNLDLEMGVGNCTVTSTLTGTNKIESGLGNLSVNLLDNIEKYKIRLKKGLGSITLNNESINENETYGTGNTSIKIEGGVGNIKVETAF